MSACRVCKKSDGATFKYSTRHYAHADCAFKKWGGEFLNMIPAHQIGNLPYKALSDAGLLDEAIRRREQQQ